MIMSRFAALCEGYLGVRPSLELFRYYYHVKRITINSGGPLQRCGSITFKIRRFRSFPNIAGHESVKGWTGSYFYCKDIPKADHDVGWPAFVDGAATPVPNWNAPPSHPLSPTTLRLKRRIEKLIEKGLKGLDLLMCWLSRRIQPLQDRNHLLHEYTELTDENMWVYKVDLPFQLLEAYLKAMMKFRTSNDKKFGCIISLDMYTKGKCPR
jgi:hypothetical protein